MIFGDHRQFVQFDDYFFEGLVYTVGGWTGAYLTIGLIYSILFYSKNILAASSIQLNDPHILS